MNGDLVKVIDADLEQMEKEPAIFWSSFVESFRAVLIEALEKMERCTQ